MERPALCKGSMGRTHIIYWPAASNQHQLERVASKTKPRYVRSGLSRTAARHRAAFRAIEPHVAAIIPAVISAPTTIIPTPTTT
jgi:hypothetical protein